MNEIRIIRFLRFRDVFRRTPKLLNKSALLAKCLLIQCGSGLRMRARGSGGNNPVRSRHGLAACLGRSVGERGKFLLLRSCLLRKRAHALAQQNATTTQKRKHIHFFRTLKIVT